MDTPKSWEHGSGHEKSADAQASALTPESGSMEGVIVDEGIKRGLKTRHAQMIALGGTIGTGLFVGSGQLLAKGGPAFILIGYATLAFLVLCIVTGAVEVATYLPVKGGTMSYFGTRNVSTSLGFAMGWMYWYSLGILVPYEITAAALVIGYWPSDIHVAVWISIFCFVIIALNVLPVKFYGETEFWFASIKVFAIIGLIILGIILFFGGGPSKDPLYFRYWKDPGATNEWLVTGSAGTFCALLGTLVGAAFPFGFAPELLILTAGEMVSPRRNLPIAANTFFIRLLIFYIGGILVIGVICPSDASALTSGGKGAGASPFVVGIANAGISALPSVINAVVITSAWSSGNSFMYMSSRSLYSMAVAGNAPAIFKKCTKAGLPYYAVAATSIFIPLAYLSCASESAKVFNWFVNITNTASFISWICCPIIFLRFRKACKVQGLPLSSLPYTSWMQPWGSYVALFAFSFLLLINGFDVFFPGRWSISTFLTAYVGIPIFLTIYFGHRYVHRHESWAIKSENVDLYSGLDAVLADEIPHVHVEGWKQKIKALLT